MSDSIILTSSDFEMLGLFLFLYTLLAFFLYDFFRFVVRFIKFRFSKPVYDPAFDPATCVQCGKLFYPDDVCLDCLEALGLDSEKSIGGKSHD